MLVLRRPLPDQSRIQAEATPRLSQTMLKTDAIHLKKVVPDPQGLMSWPGGEELLNSDGESTMNYCFSSRNKADNPVTTTHSPMIQEYSNAREKSKQVPPTRRQIA